MWKLRAAPPRSTSVRTTFLYGRSVSSLLGRAFKATIESLVNFDRLAAATHRGEQDPRPHRFANAMGEEPSGFVRNAQGPVELMGADALLAGGHQVERLKPDVQLDMAAFHDALGRHAEVLAAFPGAAAIDAGLLSREELVDCSTVRANALSSPAETFKVLAGCFVVLEMGRVELRQWSQIPR